MLELDLDTKNKLLSEGYSEILNVNIPSNNIPQRKHPIKNNIILLLHEEHKDIKILFHQIVRSFSTREELFEITKEEAYNMLDENHPVLTNINKIDFLQNSEKIISNNKKI